jgi:hypothetical protein
MIDSTSKRLMEYAGYAAPEMAGRAQHLIKLTVNEVLGIAYQELHPQAYAQLLAKIQQRFEQ